MNRTTRILTLLLTAALPLALSNCAGISAAAASKPDPGGQGNGCSNATLQGQYAFRVSGVIFVPGKPPLSVLAYRDGVAMTTFDGAGHLTQSDFIMGNGRVPSDPMQPTYVAPGDIDPTTGFTIHETGTYQVNADCTGTAEIDFPAPLSSTGPAPTTGVKISLMMVVGDNGATVHTIVSKLVLPTGTPVLVNIHSDATKVDQQGNQ